MKNTNKGEPYMNYGYEVTAPRKAKGTEVKSVKTAGGDLRARGGKSNG